MTAAIRTNDPNTERAGGRCGWSIRTSLSWSTGFESSLSFQCVVTSLPPRSGLGGGREAQMEPQRRGGDPGRGSAFAAGRRAKPGHRVWGGVCRNGLSGRGCLQNLLVVWVLVDGGLARIFHTLAGAGFVLAAPTGSRTFVTYPWANTPGARGGAQACWHDNAQHYPCDFGRATGRCRRLTIPACELRLSIKTSGGITNLCNPGRIA
jgi:hypothetical protein